MLVKARLSSKREVLRLHHFLPQKLGSFKEAHFRCVLVFIFFKKINQNWSKTIGSWHYWYKPLIWHIFSVTYQKIYTFLSVTFVLKPTTSFFSTVIFISSWFSLLETVTCLASSSNFFSPFGYLLSTNYQIATSSYSYLIHAKNKKYDLLYLG